MSAQRKDHYSNQAIRKSTRTKSKNAIDILSFFVLISVALLLFLPLTSLMEKKKTDVPKLMDYDAVEVFASFEADKNGQRYMSEEEIELAAKEYAEAHRPRFVYPLDGDITSAFAYRVDPITLDREEYHLGIDISAKNDIEISSYADGVVTRTVTDDKDYGMYVIIEHDGFETLYAHCSSLLVEKGDKVIAGENIAIAGSTGRSTGVHLHFEVRVDGERVDPLTHMHENGVERND